MNPMISISYCGDHRKGDGQVLSGQSHAQMLADCVDYLTHETGWPVLVVATGFRGHSPWQVYPPDLIELGLLWEVWRKARWVTIPENPGYLEGANWIIRGAVEAAHALGYDIILHTCEDVIPFRGVARQYVQRLVDEKSVYAGGPWKDGAVSTQFFAASVPFLYERFEARPASGLPPEPYLKSLLDGQMTSVVGERLYHHTHTPAEHRRLLQEVMRG